MTDQKYRKPLTDPRRPNRNVYRVDEYVWAGEYPGWRGPLLNNVQHSATKSTPMVLLAELLAMGVECFIDLTRVGESWTDWHNDYGRGKYQRIGLLPYDHMLPEGVWYMRYPIRDVTVPQRSFMHSIVEAVKSSRAAKRMTYVHCRGGIGRTGSVVGCYLVERNGYNGATALNEMGHLRRMCRTHFSPETGQQVDLVRSWKPSSKVDHQPRLLTTGAEFDYDGKESQVGPDETF